MIAGWAETVFVEACSVIAHQPLVVSVLAGWVVLSFVATPLIARLFKAKGPDAP